MSIKLMTGVWDNGPDSRSDTLVLLTLADHANDQGRSCYPSVPRIAKRSRLSEQGVRNVLDRLEDEGWIKRETGGGRGKSTHYYLNTGRLKPPSCLGDSNENPQSEKQNPQDETDKPSNSSGGEPSVEPSKNQQGSAPAREPDRPDDLESAIEYGEMSGVPPEITKEWFHKRESTDWHDKGGSPIRKWKSDLMLWKTRSHQYRGGSNGHTRSAEKSDEQRRKENTHRDADKYRGIFTE